MRARSEMLCFCWGSRTTESHHFFLSPYTSHSFFNIWQRFTGKKALLWVWPQWLYSFFGVLANQADLKCNLKVNSFRLKATFPSVTDAFQRFWRLSACIQQEIFWFKTPKKEEICSPRTNPIWEECNQEWISNWNMWKVDLLSCVEKAFLRPLFGWWRHLSCLEYTNNKKREICLAYTNTI